MENITVNFTGKVRRDTLNGREHIVAPMSLIVPGVLNGSKGPLYYPPEEVSKTPSVWNGIPIVKEHPTENGSSVSARSPEVLNRVGLGVIMRAKYTKNKLVAEGWFDVENTRNVDSRILDAIESGSSMELSTGLFTENEPAEDGASLNGEPYTFIARNYRPDHLAILPDTKGACSVSDGCGLLVNDEQKKILNAEGNYIGFVGSSNDHIHSVRLDEIGTGFTSFEKGHIHFVQDYVVGTSEGHTHSLDRNSLVDSGTNNSSGEKIMALKPEQKTEIVNNLITNCECWDEEDRDTLNLMKDDKLQKFNDGVKTKKVVTPAPVEDKTLNSFDDDLGNTHTYNEETKKWDTKKKEETVVNKEKPKAPQTTKEWMDAAPEEVRNTFAFASTIQEAEKVRLISSIVANVEDGEAKDNAIKVLNTKNIGELTALAILAPVPKEAAAPASNWSGAAPAASTPSKDPVFNEEDVLENPVLDFSVAG